MHDKPTILPPAMVLVLALLRTALVLLMFLSNRME